jgi:hypothetical protein
MREKASLASRLQCVLLLLVVARTAAASGVVQENWPLWMRNFKDH